MIPGNINTDLISGAEGAYQVERSLRFNSADSAYLSRTPASAGNRRTWTFSCWVKRSLLGSSFQTIFGAGTGGNAEASIRFNSDDTLEFYAWTGSYNARLLTTQVFRDVSAWYHLLAVFDTPNTTADQRIRLYVNGIEITTFSSRTNPTQNYDGYFNNSISHTIGDAVSGASPRFFNGYLADIHFIDGQALTPSSFAETNATTGQWVPKAYTGSYGTNGFRLDFSDNSAATATTLGKDRAGSNNWTPNNLSVTAGAGNDSLVDTPTSYGTDTGAGGEVRGNYCTWSPLLSNLGVGLATLSNGNLDATAPGQGTGAGATFELSDGKWYFETTITNLAGTGNVSFIGVVPIPYNPTYLRAYAHDGTYFNGSSWGAYGATFSTGDVVGCAVDLDANTIQFYKNGASQGQKTSIGLAGIRVSPFVYMWVAASTFSVNFGQRPFAYTAPSGFKALCDTNLPAPVVAKPSTVMDVVLYNGNSSNQSITSLGFSPDLVWGKSRNTNYFNTLQDTVRGAGQKILYSNSTDAENAYSQSWIDSFDSNGFTMTTGFYNQSGYSYAAWCFDAGSSTVSNTQGSITSQVRANASAGFSVVTYTVSAPNQTVGHGLGVAPAMSIAKRRNSSGGDWYARFKGGSFDGYLILNSTAAGVSAPNSFTSTTVPTAYLSSSNEEWVLYNFAPVAGYSSFGLYDAGTDPFVYLGFRPAMIIFKRSNGAENWNIVDNRRNAVGDANVVTYSLQPNSSGAEYQSEPGIDLLSNGFKLRGSFNSAGGQYIYAAWAASPFQYARAR